MKRAASASLITVILSAGAAFASERCNVPISDWQPREVLQKKLESDGWTVSRIKTDDGCYEVHATNGSGHRVEVSVDPKTFEIIKTDLED